MRVITFNANGVRSSYRKGFFSWVARQNFDVLCLQEIRLDDSQWPEIEELSSYYRYASYAEKKGYSGVAIYTRYLPISISYSYEEDENSEFSREGRYVCCDYPQGSILSVYFPSGGSSEARQIAKMRFLETFRQHMVKLKNEKNQVLICSDINIAHKTIDLKNWRANQKTPGFLPEERSWMDNLLSQDWVDVFRRLDNREGQYTWWSHRGQSWSNNVGWRIDYHIATCAVSELAYNCAIYKEERFSDHAPVIIDYHHNFLV